MNSFSEQLLERLYEMIQPEKKELFERMVVFKTNYLTVVLEHIYQQHNASAVLRSCESFGVHTLHVIDKNQAYHVQRDIARGAARWMDLMQYNGEKASEKCLLSLKKKGYRILATTPTPTSYTIETLPLDKPIALVFGTEGSGLSQQAIQLADDFVHIPTSGFTQSLNVSVATALCVYTIKKRLEQSSVEWQMNPKEQLELKIEWCKRIIPHGEKVMQELRKRMLTSF